MRESERQTLKYGVSVPTGPEKPRGVHTLRPIAVAAAGEPVGPGDADHGRVVGAEDRLGQCERHSPLVGLLGEAMTETAIGQDAAPSAHHLRPGGVDRGEGLVDEDVDYRLLHRR